MEQKLGFLLAGFFLIICALLFQESSGLGIPSTPVASLFLPIKFKNSDLTLSVGGHRFLLLQYDSTRIGSEQKEQRFVPFSSASTPNDHHFVKKSHHIAFENEPPRASFIHEGPAMAPTPYSLRTSYEWTPKEPLSSPAIPPHQLYVHNRSPAIAPTNLPIINDKKTLTPLPSVALPPLPPNKGCASLTCSDPLTYAPPGAPCGCVWPIQVKLCFSIPLYTFFPLISELAESIAASIPLNRSQVRVMGADAADQQFDKTTVLINLVPLDEMFKYATALSIYSKFWKRELSIKTSMFGAYEVLFVHYPGLPPSPPSLPTASAAVNVQPYLGSGDGDGPMKPLGAYVPRRRKSNSGKNMVMIVILSSVTAFIACTGFILLLLSKCGCCSYLYKQDQQSIVPSDEKISVAGGSPMSKSRPSSASMSFNSSLLMYTGAAKMISIEDIERATDNFNTSRILGEGGFGIVYGGILDDGRNVAVKVLKREDQQGSREFLAEVEMLSRLHHRNLVKLIAICAEEQCRCLIYELIPNGSVHYHLHGAHKEAGALDWSARMKIALGSARGLAYLHEDSSPRVIHRDFKSSNILLEQDYTPKVSDFGLARAAFDERSKHISTHVMGTFGYLAPEYALTGHLLVKSDVYSYGVVLLELLTGRKPVDLSRTPGQENLVAWARPLLETKQGLETIIDPNLKPGVPLDNFAKVAAIASMCVQPEVSHRPFMGEVVQALKLVCDEFEETREPISRTCSYEGLCTEVESNHSRASNELVIDMEKCDSMFDARTALSVVDLQSSSTGFQRESESFRRQFNSVPLRVARKESFWQRLRGLSRGSMSEHEFSSKL